MSLAAVACSIAPCLADVHVGDKVTVTVYNHPELSGDFTVDSDGTMSLPLVGRVRALGRDPIVLAGIIEKRLEEFVIKPAVEVKLEAEGDAAFVTGSTVGNISLKPGETLLAAIDDAKLPNDVDLNRVVLVRDNAVIGHYDVRAMRAAGTDGPVILSGDVIRVPTHPVNVEVLGAVKQTGNIYLEADEPLGDAIQQAGFGDDANLESITLERAGTSQLVPLGGDVLSQPGQVGDRLIVPQSQLIEVVGYVVKPGEVALKGDKTLLSAIFLAGGPGKDGDLRRVRVVHRDGQYKSYDLRGFAKGDLEQNPRLKDGDVVYVGQDMGFDFRYLFGLLYFGARFIPR